MKNLIVIDIYGCLISSIFSLNEMNIALAVLDDADVVKKVKGQYDNKIQNYYSRMPKTIDEFNLLHESDYNLTYDQIEQFRPSQLKVEKFLRRELYDEASIEARYFTALKYFLGFFENNKIDFVISAHLEHGAIWDSLIFDIAKSKSIPVYLISAITANGDKELNCIIEKNTRTIIPLDKIKNKGGFDSKEFFHKLNSYYFSMKIRSKPKLKIIKRLLNKIKYVKVAMQEAFTGFNKNDVKLNGKYFTQINFKQDELTKQKIYIENLLNTYKKLSIEPDYKRNYIFYPLHQEPEATIAVRTTMSNQLFIIEQISKYLPKDFYLYVKEHPSEFYVYKEAPYFYKNIDYFRSIDFYKKIKLLRNVKLISLDAPTQELMKNAMAINTITGTALLEGVMMNKPIIIWGDGVNVLEKLKDSFNIRSTKCLIDSINAITMGFKPVYSELDEIMSKFTFYSSNYGVTETLSRNKLYEEILIELSRITKV